MRFRLAAAAVPCLFAGLAVGLAAQAPAPPKVTGYLQPRFEANGDSALFKLRRGRLGAQGALTTWASYKAQVEVRSGGAGATAATVAATDLYVALTRGAWSGTVGQFKTPFSRSFLTSSTVLELPERPLVVDALVPNRDIGVAAGWARPDRVTVQAGVFNGEGVNRAANPDKRFLYVGRVVVTPAPGVDLGGNAAGGPDSTGWGIEASVQRRGWTLRAEYLTRHREAADDDAKGWYALGAYRLPRRPVQLVAQVEEYDPTGAAGDRTNGFTGGAQYFIRGDGFKVMFAYTAFTEEGASVSNDRVILQLQARF